VAFSFESFNLPNRFIRHSFFLAELDLRHAGNDADFCFDVVPRDQLLGVAWVVGLRSMNFPKLYLRHQDRRLKLQSPPEDDSEQWVTDSSFHLEPGLADADANCVSFRSMSHPDRYIQHRDLHLFVEPLNRPDARLDATFRVVPDQPFGR
jgi:Alpha-L-arabinofuranosidase B (ABFB) domain